MNYLTRPPSDVIAPGPGYHPVASLASAELAATVYATREEWQAATGRAGWDRAYLVDRGGAQAGIVASPAAVVVVARGSSQACDWRDDFDAWPVAYDLVDDGLVCKGFRRQARILAFDVVQLVTWARQEFPAAPVVVTGHSLGAALAPLLALALRGAGPTPQAVYCHESPRWATRAAAHWYDEELGARTFRVVTVERGCQDLVTRVPPSALGYWHVGVPEIVVDGVRYESEAKWEEVRRVIRPGWVQRWRVLRRLFQGVDAHLSASLLRTLRGVQSAG